MKRKNSGKLWNDKYPKQVKRIVQVRENLWRGHGGKYYHYLPSSENNKVKVKKGKFLIYF
jgi:hypothetical protein